MSQSKELQFTEIAQMRFLPGDQAIWNSTVEDSAVSGFFGGLNQVFPHTYRDYPHATTPVLKPSPAARIRERPQISLSTEKLRVADVAGISGRLALSRSFSFLDFQTYPDATATGRSAESHGLTMEVLCPVEFPENRPGQTETAILTRKMTVTAEGTSDICSISLPLITPAVTFDMSPTHTQELLDAAIEGQLQAQPLLSAINKPGVWPSVAAAQVPELSEWTGPEPFPFERGVTKAIAIVDGIAKNGLVVVTR